MLIDRTLDHFCEQCGVRISLATRGPLPRFCSPTCQGRSWRHRHADSEYVRTAQNWATSSEEYRDGVRRRARARARALSDLSYRYPKLYRDLYLRHLAKEQDG